MAPVNTLPNLAKRYHIYHIKVMHLQEGRLSCIIQVGLKSRDPFLAEVRGSHDSRRMIRQI